MHLVLEIDTEKALESMMERTANDLKESLMENKVRFRNVEKAKGATISLQLTEASARATLDKLLRDHFPDLEIASSNPRESGQFITIKINDRKEPLISRN